MLHDRAKEGIEWVVTCICIVLGSMEQACRLMFEGNVVSHHGKGIVLGRIVPGVCVLSLKATGVGGG